MRQNRKDRYRKNNLMIPVFCLFFGMLQDSMAVSWTVFIFVVSYVYLCL